MTVFHSPLRTCLLVVLGGTSIGVASQTAYGQICPGSHLTYIVRDEKGLAIDAESKALRRDVTTDTDSPSSKWKVTDRDFVRVSGTQVPDSISKLRGKITGLETSAMCNFKQPVNLQLTMKGKTMSLTFLVPKLSEYASRDFLVDSSSFQQGTFEIDLSASEDRSSQFYSATGWKKLK
jgi:hypothetical protein